MTGDADKLSILMDTLRILAIYAKTKLIEQQAEAEGRRIKAAIKVTEAVERNLNETNSLENQLRQARVDLDKRLDSILQRHEQNKRESEADIHPENAEQLRERQQTTDGIGSGTTGAT